MSELFDGLFRPGDAGLLAIEKFIRDPKAAPRLPDDAEQWAHDMRQILQTYGRSFRGRETPREYRHNYGPPQVCFRNAMTAAMRDPSLTYYEGLYTVGGNMPAPHGWCVAPDGGVVELTFPTTGSTENDWVADMGPWMPPEHWSYFGAPIPLEFVIRHWNDGGDSAIISYCTRDHSHTAAFG
jgi:hypothetical protein